MNLDLYDMLVENLGIETLLKDTYYKALPADKANEVLEFIATMHDIPVEDDSEQDYLFF